MALEFVEQREVDLVMRVAKGRFLTLDELAGYADRCRRSGLQESITVVGNSYAALRFRVFIHYINWIAEPIIARIVDDNKRAAANAALLRFLKRAKSVAPRVDAESPVPGERKGMLLEQRELFLRVIRPDCPENPFGEKLRLRNYVLLMLEFALGPRGGEVRGLKTRDFDFSRYPATVVIHRRHDDPEDTRKIPAQAKTRGRILELGDELSDAVSDWIMTQRSDKNMFPQARKNPYLITNYRGEPMGDRGFRQVIETLRRHYPQLGQLCHQMLRHDWNERYTEDAEEHGDDQSISRRDQIYAMGWKPHSTMPEHYAAGAIEKSTNKKILRMQAKDLYKEPK